MLGVLHHDTYFDRMRASLGSKTKLLAWLAPGTVLDVGAGDGSLVRLMRSAGWDAVGLDAAETSVERSGGLVRYGRAEDADQVFAGRTFDNIVFCSALHEVWSYGAGQASWEAALDAAARLLAPGGRIVVRDGVGPKAPDELWQLTVRDPGDASAFLAAWTAQMAPLLGTAKLGMVGDYLYGPAWLVAEFLLTYCWGWDSLPREGSEWYTVAGDPASYARRLERRTGLRLLHFEQELQDGYRDAFGRIGRLRELTSRGWGRVDWPKSNAIWVLGTPRPEPEGAHHG